MTNMNDGCTGGAMEARGEQRGLSQSDELADVMVALPKVVWTVPDLADRTGIDESNIEVYLRVWADVGVVRRIDPHVEQDWYRWMWVGYGPGGRG